MKYINAKTLTLAFALGTAVALYSMNRRFGSASNAMDAVKHDPRVKEASSAASEFAQEKIDDVEGRLGNVTQRLADSVKHKADSIQDILADARDVGQKAVS